MTEISNNLKKIIYNPYKFDNGDIYEGEIINEMPYGIGKMTYLSGNIYEGNFNNGLPNGIGIMKYLNKDIYEGNFLNGLFNGYGIMTFANGDIYEGNFLNGLFNDGGILTLAIGDIYEGNWKENKIINGYYYNNGIDYEIIDGVINKKPDSLKSVPIIKQLKPDCWAHLVSRNFVRTFQILNIIEMEHIESFYFLFYNILTRYQSCDIGVPSDTAMVYLLDFLEKNYLNIFDITSDGNECTKLYCKKSGVILNVNESEKSEIIRKFKYLFDNKLLFIGKCNYIVNLDGNNKPSDAIKKMLDFRLQPVVSISVSNYLISQIKKYSFEIPTVTDVDTYDNKCIVNTNYYHGVNLRRWTNSYIEFKNSWGKIFSKKGNFSVSDLKYLICVERNTAKINPDMSFISLMFDFEKMDEDYKSIVNTKIESYNKTFDDSLVTDKNKNYSGSYNSYELFEGEGAYLFGNSNNYIGAWKNGLMHGFGVFTYSNGDKYEGELLNGNRDGYGILIYNGSKYDGNWKDNKKNGHGIYTFIDKNQYDGNFKDDKLDGYGILTYNNGDKYEGNWKDNKKNGVGILTMTGGHKYEGNWKDDKKNGWGIATYADGLIYYQNWINGSCVLNSTDKPADIVFTFITPILKIKNKYLKYKFKYLQLKKIYSNNTKNY